LGPLRVTLNDHPIESWPGSRGRAIFKYLLTHRAQPMPRDVLMDLFWPEAGPEAARNSLNVAMYGLRQALKAAADVPVVLFQNAAYRLSPDLHVWLDVEEFEHHVQAGQQLEAAGQIAAAIAEYEMAVDLYQGDFFEEDLYEDWLIRRRESLKDSYLAILNQLSRYYLEEKNYTTCIHLCQKLLAKDDCREDTHRRLMRCYSRQGQRNLALRQYQLCTEALARALDVTPMAETVALYQQIRDKAPV
jgi:DNA-binding SARP family transcriptional activator